MEGQKCGVSVLPEAFVAAMRQETDQMLRQVMQAVNDAPDGAWINASETRVRDVPGEYRRRVYEHALQMKTDVAEGAFSPGGHSDGQTPQKQRV
jgi:hypothetical protein